LTPILGKGSWGGDNQACMKGTSSAEKLCALAGGKVPGFGARKATPRGPGAKKKKEWEIRRRIGFSTGKKKRVRRERGKEGRCEIRITRLGKEKKHQMKSKKGKGLKTSPMK